MKRLTHQRNNGIKEGLDPEEITVGAMSKEQFEKACISVKELCESEYPKFVNDGYYKILDAMKNCIWVYLTVHKGIYTSEQVCELFEIAEEVATRSIKE